MREKFADLSFPDAPKIIVKPPGPKARKILEEEQKYIAKGVFDVSKDAPLLPVVLESGKGSTVRDVDGNIYIDFSAGWHVTNTGHCHPKIVRAIKEQSEKLLNCDSFAHEIRYLAAKKLAQIAPKGLNKSYFVSSGSDAGENAVKIARNYTKKHDIIAFHRCFHGRTFLAGAMTGAAGMGKDMGPYASRILHAPSPYCYRCPFKLEYPDCSVVCADYVEEVIKNESPNDVAAIIIEPFPGTCCMPDEFLPKLKEICEKYDILFIAEEVATGIGRTGKMFAIEHWNITPDILCVDKGLGSGVPASAVIAREELIDAMPAGSAITTYGQNPLTCAAAIATIDLMLEEKISENAAEVGKYMLKRLREMIDKYELIGDARGKGLRVIVELVKDKKTKEPALDETQKIYYSVYEKGLLPLFPAVRWTPPLILTKGLADKGIDIFEEALKEMK